MIKLILRALAFYFVLIPNIVFAQATANDLVGLCAFDGGCAAYIADNVAGGAVISNAAFLTGRNQANSANVNLIGIDTGDNTLINSSASDLLILRLEDDVQRLISFDGSADTLLELFWGDGGTTAAQNFDIRGGTSDADDDQRLCLTGGGACADATRGAFATFSGEQDADGGDAVITSVDDVIITGTDDVVIQGQGSGDIVTIAGGGTTVDLTVADNVITVADGTALDVGNSLGWDGAEAANQACSTTCGVSDCVIGFDGTNFVTCADATADVCLCDGAAA